MAMKKRIRLRWVALLTAVLLLGLPLYGFADNVISVTVTPATVGVTVNPTSVAYGLLAYDTVSGAQSITATNTGTSAANLQIQGAVASDGATSTWTLASSRGENQYTHEFNDGTNWGFLTTSAQTLKNGVAAGGTADFQLRLGMPTSSGSTAQHSTTVTVIATMP